MSGPHTTPHNSAGLAWAPTMGHCITAMAVIGAWERNNTWKSLVKAHLGVSRQEFQRLLDHGESILLNNLIKTMDIFHRESLGFPNVLRSISDFDVNGTCPELQDQFCSLWNRIAEEERCLQNEGLPVTFHFILEETQAIFDVLHTRPSTSLPPLAPTPSTPLAPPQGPHFLLTLLVTTVYATYDVLQALVGAYR